MLVVVVGCLVVMIVAPQHTGVGGGKRRLAGWHRRRQEIEKAMIYLCEYSKSKLLGEGGEYVDQPDPFQYWTIKVLEVAFVAFVGIVGLTTIALRYWRWLRT